MSKGEGILKIVKILYDLFLKGRSIKTPIGPIVLPSKNHPGPNAPFDRPHEPGPPVARGLMMQSGVTSGPPEPAPIKTLGFLIFIIFGVPIACVVAIAGVEWKTLRDDTPGNHITATLRWAFAKQPAAVTLALILWVAFLTAIAFGVGAHAWWQ